MTLKDMVSGKKKGEMESTRREFPLYGIQRDINRIFDDFFKEFNIGFYEENRFAPKIDMTETEKEIVVRAEIPGVNEKEIDISLTQDMLTIKGEKKLEKEEKNENYYHLERSYGKFQRSVHLPVRVNENQVKAEYKNGILKIVLPKSGETKPNTKKIEVKTD